MQTIGIICACKSELKPFLSYIENQKITEKAGFIFYEGNIGKVHVAAVQCGICKVNAALGAQILIDLFHVDGIINSGTAGGMDPVLQIFDTVVAEKAAYHDVEESILTEEYPYMESIYFESDRKMFAASKEYSRNCGGRVFFGNMVTGEQFIEDERRDEINGRFAPLCVDMETAGIAHACYINKVPFLAVRTITDTAEHKGLETYSNNSHKAGEIAAQVVMGLLEEELIRQLETAASDYDLEGDEEDMEDDRFGDLDVRRQQILQKNKILLDQFCNVLEDKGLSEKTIRQHLSNAEFYINDYLMSYMSMPAYEGHMCVEGFLGDFFLRKCMWSTPASIKSYTASLKKFYRFMVDCGQIDKADYKDLCDTIKESLPSWQEECERYNDPNTDYFDDFEW